MKKPILVGIVLIMTMLFFMYREKNQEKESTPQKQMKQEVQVKQHQFNLSFESFNEWTIPAGEVGMDILVSSDALKQMFYYLLKL